MPFVQRNWKGEIAGLYANAQPDFPTEELTADHPDVLAFEAKHPIPPEMLRPSTEQEMRQINEMHKRVADDHEDIRAAVSMFNQQFSGLETSLSALLYATLNIRTSHVAYAIYFSPTSFDARSELVGNAVIQIASENAPLSDLLPLWESLAKKIDRSRRLRNAIAHGSPLTIAIGRKNYARLAPPAFDIIRIGRKVANKRIPGLGPNEITQGHKKWSRLLLCVDHVNRLIQAFHEGDPSLPEKYAALRLGLTELGNQ